VSIKGQAYLYKRKDGIWMFQIFVPKYLRFLYPCRMWRKTTSTRDLNEARRFRNYLLLEWEELKRKYNPSNHQWLQQSIAALHTEEEEQEPPSTCNAILFDSHSVPITGRIRRKL
jgi:hypothetical protein